MHGRNMSIITRRSLFHMFDVLEWQKKRKMCEFRLCGFSLILCHNSFCAADVSLCSIRISDVSSFFSMSHLYRYFCCSLSCHQVETEKNRTLDTHLFIFFCCDFFFCVAGPGSSCVSLFHYLNSRWLHVQCFHSTVCLSCKQKKTPPSEKCEPINCVFSLFCIFFPFSRTHTLAVS